MSALPPSLRNIPLSYATCSIGSSDTDTLPRKLEAIRDAGYTAIELAFPDIVAYASHVSGHPVSTDDHEQILSVVGEIRKLCQANSLSVMMLQPFAHFEGWPRGSEQTRKAFSRAKFWIEVMDVVGADILQVRPLTNPY